MRRLVVALILFASPLRAQESQQPTRFAVALSAPAGCPSAAEFSAGVIGRTDMATPARSPDQTDLALSVVVTRRGSALFGQLTLRWANESGIARREVEAASCAEVLDALAFVAALAIDPRAQATAAKVEPVAPIGDSAPPDLSPPAAELPPAAAPDLEPASAAPAAVAPGQVSGHSDWYASVGLGVEVGTASSGPGPLLGVRFGGGVGLRLDPGLAAELQLEGVRRAASADPPSGQAQFTLLALRLSPCARAALGSRLSAHGCVGAEMGTLAAEASGVNRARSASSLWLAASAAAGLEGRVVGGLGVGVELGALVPTKRDYFVFLDRSSNQDAEVFAVPSVAASGTLYVRARFP